VITLVRFTFFDSVAIPSEFKRFYETRFGDPKIDIFILQVVLGMLMDLRSNLFSRPSGVSPVLALFGGSVLAFTMSAHDNARPCFPVRFVPPAIPVKPAKIAQEWLPPVSECFL
jgi:hypothetical protein